MDSLNTGQGRELQRSENTVNYTNKNKETVSSLKPLASKASSLEANISKINALIPGRSANGEGATAIKLVTKEDIALSVNTICSLVGPYALEIGDLTLFNAVNFTTSDVLQMRDVTVFGFVGTLVGVINPLLSRPDFKEYPVTPEMLTDVTETATKFNSSLSDTQIIDKSSSIASANIDSILAENRVIIRRMVKLVNYFKKTNPDFVSGFRKAAAVVNTGIHHSGVKGIITSSNAGSPVENASVTLQGKKNKKAVLTNSEGEYEISKFVAGDAKLIITAPGFESQTVAVKIVRGVMQKQSITLQSNAVELPAIQTA